MADTSRLPSRFSGLRAKGNDKLSLAAAAAEIQGSLICISFNPLMDCVRAIKPPRLRIPMPDLASRRGAAGAAMVELARAVCWVIKSAPGTGP